jgi:hypothetical protein
MFPRVHQFLTLALGIAVLLVTALPAHARAQADRRCFPETSFCIEGRIRQFWEQNGGLPVFGLPIASQQQEIIEGQPFQVQWFERNRLELHPEQARPYDVLLGRLGADSLTRLGRDPFAWPTSEPQNGCKFFPATGHNVCDAILSAWRANGLELDGRSGTSEAESLALFGLPLGDAQTEMIAGQEYTVQWFERARFELHPENAPPYNVLLGLLGNDLRSPLNDVFGQAGGGETFMFVNQPGTLDTQFASAEDCRRTGQQGLRLAYNFTGSGNGGWVFHWANAPGGRFDAAQLTTLTFWVRGSAPNGFQIGLRDTSEHEAKVESRNFVAVSADEWRKVSVPLGQFADASGTIDPAAIKNFNFGFNASHGAGSICIDDIAFQPGPASPLPDVMIAAQQAAGAQAFHWQYEPGALAERFTEAEECRHSGSYGLQLIYGFSGTGNGGWGVHWANTPTRHFDAAAFSTLSFWVRGAAPQGFHIGIKDSAQKEVKVESRDYTIVDTAEWRQISVPLSAFADRAGKVNPGAVENISIGFSGDHGSGSICVDEIGFQ